MNLSQYNINAFAIEAVNSFDLSGFSLDVNAAVESMKREISKNFKDINSEKTKKARLERFKIGDLDDYTERLVDLGNGRKVICGIRHKGLSSDLPFINCLANFKISSRDDALKIAENIRPIFNIFKPLEICFWSNQKIECDNIGSAYFVNDSSTILRSEKWREEESFEFREVENDQYYTWYKESYNDFHREHPNLSSKVPLNDQETMKASMDQGLLHFVEIQAERIGLIAAVRDDFLGHPGLYFNEILISKKWKGRGFAKAIQRKFITENVEDNIIIWGTIDYSNLPSMRTASSNARRAIRFECFVKIP